MLSNVKWAARQRDADLGRRCTASHHQSIMFMQSANACLQPLFFSCAGPQCCRFCIRIDAIDNIEFRVYGRSKQVSIVSEKCSTLPQCQALKTHSARSLKTSPNASRTKSSRRSSLLPFRTSKMQSERSRPNKPLGGRA